MSNKLQILLMMLLAFTFYCDILFNDYVEKPTIRFCATPDRVVCRNENWEHGGLEKECKNNFENVDSCSPADIFVVCFYDHSESHWTVFNYTYNLIINNSEYIFEETGKQFTAGDQEAYIDYLEGEEDLDSDVYCATRLKDLKKRLDDEDITY